MFIFESMDLRIIMVVYFLIRNLFKKKFNKVNIF